MHRQPRFLLPPPPRRVSETVNLRYTVMDRYGEKLSTFYARLVNRLGRKQHPFILPPSKSTIGSPKPQTSLGTSSSLSSPDRILIRSIPFSQFSNSQTSLSSQSSLISPQSRGSPTTAHGSAANMVWRSVGTAAGVCSFYDR